MLVGGQCPGIDLLEEMTGLMFRTLNTGSSSGFSAISGGIADIACVNMVDADGNYNLSVLKRMDIENVVLVKGYRREQGLIFKPDNHVYSLEDIINLQIINRNRGSGTRALLDREIGLLAEMKGVAKSEIIKNLKGYNSGSKNHRSVCDTVKSGKADIGFGLRAASEEAGLEFIPVAEDEFDFVIRKDLLEISEIQKFLEVLRSDDFAKRLPHGISTHETTGSIITSF
jgi:putative molybdopterin biosynthesis protein